VSSHLLHQEPLWLKALLLRVPEAFESYISLHSARSAYGLTALGRTNSSNLRCQARGRIRVRKTHLCKKMVRKHEVAWENAICLDLDQRCRNLSFAKKQPRFAICNQFDFEPTYADGDWAGQMPRVNSRMNPCCAEDALSSVSLADSPARLPQMIIPPAPAALTQNDILLGAEFDLRRTLISTSSFAT
jgi:hypothetical protein